LGNLKREGTLLQANQRRNKKKKTTMRRKGPGKNRTIKNSEPLLKGSQTQKPSHPEGERGKSFGILGWVVTNCECLPKREAKLKRIAQKIKNVGKNQPQKNTV